MTPVLGEQGKVLESGEYGNFTKMTPDARGNLKTEQGTRLHIEHDTSGGSAMIIDQQNDTGIEVLRGRPQMIAKSLRQNGHLSILLKPGDQVLVDNVRLTGK